MKKILIILLIIVVSCQKDPKEYLEKNHDSLLKAYFSSDSILADGTSLDTLTIELDKVATNREIQLSTTDGSFLFGTNSFTISAVNVNNVIRAIALLKSTNRESNLVQVKVRAGSGNLEKTLQLRFQKAYAEKMRMQSSYTSIRNTLNNSLDFETHLMRNIGVPSLFQTVTYTATLNDSVPTGSFYFVGPGSDSTGTIRSKFILTDTIPGLLKIFSNYSTPDSELKDSLLIQITR